MNNECFGESGKKTAAATTVTVAEVVKNWGGEVEGMIKRFYCFSFFFSVSETDNEVELRDSGA